MDRKSFAQVVFTGLVAMGMLEAAAAKAQGTSRQIEVIAKRFAFYPSEVTLKKGEPVILIVKSTDVAHGIRFRELKVEVNVRAGATSKVEFTPQQVGDFVGHCSVFCGAGHGSMALKLHVVN